MNTLHPPHYPIHNRLYWLLIKFHINFKILPLTYKATPRPQLYLSVLIHVATPSCTLRSSYSFHLFSTVPSACLTTMESGPALVPDSGTLVHFPIEILKNTSPSKILSGNPPVQDFLTLTLTLLSLNVFCLFSCQPNFDTFDFPFFF